jgi:hypothetical protein
MNKEEKKEIMKTINIHVKQNGISLEQLKQIEDCIKKILYPSNTAKSEFNNSKNSILKNFTLLRVAPDGKCFYHAIFSALQNKNSQFLISYGLNNGFDIRQRLIYQIDEWLYNDTANTNSDKINNLIINLSDAIYHEQIEYNNGNNFKNKMAKNVPKYTRLNDIRKRLTDINWGGIPLLPLVSFIFDIPISYYNARFHHMDNMNHNNINESMRIYLYFNGNDHFDALIPKKKNK